MMPLLYIYDVLPDDTAALAQALMHAIHSPGRRTQAHPGRTSYSVPLHPAGEFFFRMAERTEIEFVPPA
ncbi:hypothetical protein AV903_22210 [Erwinia tracheiphila]|uniref:Uncharacterized protein n=1 Tax=Erwinia tracheiphila TaxID=65700 RepID=A0A345CXE4_9GAMM|nr:hypothetical protein AV903_22210 [Erwinia tracheiphila]